MNKGIKFIVFACTVVIIAGGCSKGGTPAVDDPHAIDFTDSTFPVLELTAPLDNQVFTTGDIIKIDGKVTDNGLYRGIIKIINDVGGASVKEQEFEVHGLQSYNFHVEYKTAVTTTSNYTVSVQFEDHGTNITVKSLKVSVNP